MEKKVPTTADEAQLMINDLVSQAYKCISEAEELSKKFEIGFSFDIAYGMGGYFEPEEGEWQSSSSSC